MADYIKREDAARVMAILMAAEAEADGYPDAPIDNYIEYALEDLEDIPSADVAPVRHGRWIYEGNELVCSSCGGSVSFSRNNDGLALSGKAWALGIYCQTCGAKMDEGETDGINYR